MSVWSESSAAAAAAAVVGAADAALEEVVGAPAAGAAGVGEAVGVGWVVGAVVTVGVTAVAVAVAAAACAVDAESVVDASAEGLQTFPGDAASAAADQPVSRFDYPGRFPASSGHAAAALVAGAPSGVVRGAVQGLAVSAGAANDTDGVFAVHAAVSCINFLPGVDSAGFRYAVGDSEARGELTGSAQQMLGGDSGRP